MITSITDNNLVHYRVLYDQASDVLSGYDRVRTYEIGQTYYYKDGLAVKEDEVFVPIEGIKNLKDFSDQLALHSGILYIKARDKAPGFNTVKGIKTLEEYFSWLGTLGRINLRYTILPLDEPHFEINANTRAITVPASFKKNGIAVQGDDLAEILYFKIDRYFDYMDLNNCDIFIQWETPKDANGNTFKSASPAYIRDIESEPGKLIFGWILDDNITANAGTLKFSVRFYQWNNKEDAKKEDGEKLLAYSFSTLTTSVTIQPSIGFNPEEDSPMTEDLRSILIERIQDGVVIGNYYAAAPIFIQNLSDNEYDCDEEGTVLSVMALAPDTGGISYTWKKQELNDDNTVAEDKPMSYPENENIFVPVDKTNLDPRIAYWAAEGDNYPILIGYKELTPEELDRDTYHVFERHASIKVELPEGESESGASGIYWAVAENRLTNSSTPLDSIRAVFPRPKDIVITKAPEKSAILTGEKGKETCVLSVQVEDMSVEDSNPQRKTYKWTYNPDASLNFNASDDSVTFSDVDDGDSSSIVVSKEGHYKVTISNKRNGVTKTATPEIITRVTKAAEEPKIKTLSAAEKQFSLASLSDNNCPTIELLPDVISDYYIVKWYYTEENPNWKEDVKIFEQELTGPVAKFNPRAHADAIKEVSTDKDLDGLYYPIIYNHVNGSKAWTDKPTTLSDFFTITN